MSHRTRSTLTLLAAAALLATTAACSAGTATSSEATATKPPVRSSEQRQVTATDSANGRDAAGDSAQPVGSVERAPGLDSGKVLVRQNGTYDSRALEFPEAGKGDGDALVIAVQCHGKGRLTVRLRPVSADFPVTCRAGEVSSVYHQFAVSRARDAGTVAVTASSGSVRWSLTVGRAAPATTDLKP